MAALSHTAPDVAAEASALAARLPALLAQARQAAATLYLGAHGRRRAGFGETFWQHRPHRQEEGLRRVDWRRSAREDDRLYVRETEWQSVETIGFWRDPRPGFQWRSAPHLPRKGDRALVLLTALAMALARGGERVGALGAARGPKSGARAGEAIAEGLAHLAADAAFPGPPRFRGPIIIAADFYEPVEVWAARLSPQAQRGPGVLLAIADPAEESFPFAGRTRFLGMDAPAERVFGRAERLRNAYGAALAENRRALTALTARLGWRLLLHRTDLPAQPALLALAAAVSGETGFAAAAKQAETA